MPIDLHDRTALITGSSTGLGKGIALALGRAGARVAINYAHNVERAEATLAEAHAEGIDARLYRASVVEEEDVHTMVRAIERDLGPVDILVPNATPAQPQLPIEEYDWAFHQQMLEFFVKSPFLLARAVLPSMKQRRTGRIINICSEVYQQSTGNFSAYVAAKGAQQGWSRSMATELAPWGITVNCVNPGWIPVERHANDPEELKDAYVAGVPLGRFGVPEDVAQAVCYFASDEAAFLTGQLLCVNGGNSHTI